MRHRTLAISSYIGTVPLCLFCSFPVFVIRPRFFSSVNVFTAGVTDCSFLYIFFLISLTWRVFFPKLSLIYIKYNIFSNYFPKKIVKSIIFNIIQWFSVKELSCHFSSTTSKFLKIQNLTSSLTLLGFLPNTRSSIYMKTFTWIEYNFLISAIGNSSIQLPSSL